MRECLICKRCFTDDILICSDDGIPTTSSIPVGPILEDRYELLKRLGEGSTGVVFKGRDNTLNRDCAIKVFLPPLADNDPRRTLSYPAVDIRHPNVVRLFEFGITSSGVRFLVMELVAGRSLQQILAEERVMPPEQALEFAFQIGEGLQAAHEQGIVHGDLNPSRIMVQKGTGIEFDLKILDVGLAKLRWIDEIRFFRPAEPSALLRSALYKAPEQWSAEEPDARADVYSLGIILYQMLTGDLPFKGSSITAIRRQHLRTPVPSLASAGVDVPPQLEAVVRHALEKEVTARTGSVEAFLRELREAEYDSFEESDRSVDHGSDCIIIDGVKPRIEFERLDEERRKAEVLLERFRRARREQIENARPPTNVQTRRGTREPPRAQQLDENVQFTVYRPRAVEPERWYSLFVYAHLSERPPDAPPGTPHPKEEVERKAREALGNTFYAYYDNVADSLHSIPLEGILTFVATFEGIEFIPDQHRLLWEGPVHELEFKMRARRALEGQTVRGHLRVYLGILLVGEVSVAIRVSTHEALKYGEAPVFLDRPVACYRKIFASYSHSDAAVVEQFEHLVEAFGDKYLRDVRDIRAGEKWDERLEELIREADIFQLFWSKNSMRSKFVRDEWEYALKLKKHDFIRPTFWEVPMPEDRALGLPPAALLRLQFKRVPIYSDQPSTSQDLRGFSASTDSPLLELDSRSGTGGRGAFGSLVESAPKPFPRWTLPLFAMTVFLALGAIAFLIWYLFK